MEDFQDFLDELKELVESYQESDSVKHLPEVDFSTNPVVHTDANGRRGRASEITDEHVAAAIFKFKNCIADNIETHGLRALEWPSTRGYMTSMLRLMDLRDQREANEEFVY